MSRPSDELGAADLEGVILYEGAALKFWPELRWRADYNTAERVSWAAIKIALAEIVGTRAREGHIFQLVMTVPVCAAMQGVDDLNWDQNTHDSSVDGV